MKTSFAAALFASLVLGTSAVLGAVHPNPTAAIHHHKRQQFPQGIDISAMLADPSSYLSGVSTALAKDGNAQLYAQQWASATNDPSFQASVSSVLISQFGTKTAKIALAQFTSAAEDLEDCTTSTADASAVTAGVVNADVNSGSDAQQQVSNAIVSGASGISPVGVTGLVMAAVPAILVAIL